MDKLIWESVTGLFLEWFLSSLSLWLVSKKLRWKKRWWAWVPGLRWYAFGESVGMLRDGIILGVLDAVNILFSFIPNPSGTRLTIIIALMLIVISIIRFIYGIRLFLGFMRLFGLNRKWLVLRLFFGTVPILLVGVMARFEPITLEIPDEDWQAGTTPAEIAAREHSAAEMQTTGLSVRLRERTVRDMNKKRYLLKDINVDIPNGSMVLLLGGSGAGKTTFLNAITGYEQADATILLNGTDVYREQESMRYRIGFVTQQNLFRGGDTVQNTINDAALMRMPADTSKEARDKRVKEVMDLLGLTAGAAGLVKKKSGGQLRRISIGMELLSDPELFILDEPDSGLDGVIARELFTKLRTVADEGRIVMVITHTPDRVADLFDRVIVLARDSGRCGRLAFAGKTDDARKFFGKDTMEGIVMTISNPDTGGEGRQDEFIERFAAEGSVRI